MTLAADRIASRQRRQRAVRSSTVRVMVLVAVVAVLPYVNALTAGFTFDDEADIRKNTAVTGGVDLVGILATPMFPGDLYRPFTVFTYAVNESLTPGSARAFHAVNLALHAAVTALVYLLARTLFTRRRLAVIAAAVFAVHPIHTEAVTSLVGRAELLATLFGLIAILTGAAADQVPASFRRSLLHLLSVASFSLALLSKESAVAVLPLLVFFRIARRRQSLLPGLRHEVCSFEWLPYALSFAVFMLFRSYVIEPLTVTPINNPLAHVPAVVRVRSALGVLWDYFGLLNLPFILTADYSYNQVALVGSWFAPRFIGGLVLMLVAAAVAWRHPRPAVQFAAVFPFVALAVTSNVLFPIGTPKAERLLYLPSVGWVLVAAYVVDRCWRVPRYRSAAVAVLVAVVGAFAARTWVRNADWKDNPTLFATMARTTPNSTKSHYNFGVILLEQGRYGAARREFEHALVLAPWSDDAAFALANTYEKMGNVGEAREWYTRTLAITPEYKKAHINLCRLLFLSAEFDSAITACRRGLRFAPADPILLEGLGASLASSGAVETGLAVMHRALALNGQDAALRTYVTAWETSARERTTGRLE